MEGRGEKEREEEDQGGNDEVIQRGREKKVFGEIA